MPVTTVDVAREDTFPKLIARNARLRPDRVAFRHKDLGIWQSWNWREMHETVRAMAIGLHKLGLERGDRIAIIGNNRPRLYWAIAAAQWIGVVPIPVYSDSVAEEMAYVLGHAEVKLAVVEDQEQVDKVLSIAERVPTLTYLLYDEERGLRDYDHARMQALSAFIEDGRRTLEQDAKAEAFLGEALATGKGEDLAIILYTSGTTGRPKGVMLSYDNVIAAAKIGCDFDNLNDQDEIIAYLPLAWVGDHIFSYAQAILAGLCVNCPESPETIADDRREIGTTYAFAPPRVFESMLTLTMVRMEDASRVKRAMFKFFIDHAGKVGERILNKESVNPWDRLVYAIGDFLVYSPLRNRFGLDKTKVGYTAGEAIGPEIFSFYRSIGVNLKQLYGQTEASVYVTMQPDGEIHADTVGRPAPGVEIKIDDNGEVLFRSPGVFLGYYKDEAKTAETKTPDGFVRSGDAGFFDPKTGHLRIIDRAKDVGKLNDGSLFPPKYVENKLKFYPNIKEVVAFGHARDFVTCFINIDLTAVGNWAERNNVIYASYQELAQNPRVYEMIAAHVDEVNRSLAAEPRMGGAQVKRFLILHKELDADDGELTRTQKVRRGFIAERYEPLVTALYDGSTEADIRTEVTFEDGRKGVIAARVKIRDMPIHPVTTEAAAMEKAA